MPRYNGPIPRGKLFNIATIDPKRGQMSAKYAAKYAANGANNGANGANNGANNGAKNGANNGANNLEPFIESIKHITSNNVTRRKQLKRRIGNAINKGNHKFLNNVQRFIEVFYHPKPINPRGIRSSQQDSLQSRKLTHNLGNSHERQRNEEALHNNTKNRKPTKGHKVQFKGNVGSNNNGTIIRPNYRHTNIKFEPYNETLDDDVPPPKPPRPN